MYSLRRSAQGVIDMGKCVVFDNRHDVVDDVYHETEDETKTLCGRLVANGYITDNEGLGEVQPNCATCRRVRAARERRAK